MINDYEYRLVPDYTDKEYYIEERLKTIWGGAWRWQKADHGVIHKPYSTYNKEDAIKKVNEIKKAREDWYRRHREDEKRIKEGTIYL